MAKRHGDVLRGDAKRAMAAAVAAGLELEGLSLPEDVFASGKLVPAEVSRQVAGFCGGWLGQLRRISDSAFDAWVEEKSADIRSRLSANRAIVMAELEPFFGYRDTDEQLRRLAPAVEGAYAVEVRSVQTPTAPLLQPVPPPVAPAPPQIPVPPQPFGAPAAAAPQPPPVHVPAAPYGHVVVNVVFGNGQFAVQPAVPPGTPAALFVLLNPGAAAREFVESATARAKGGALTHATYHYFDVRRVRFPGETAYVQLKDRLGPVFVKGIQRELQRMGVGGVTVRLELRSNAVKISAQW